MDGPFSFAGKRAVVTGAGGGIGQAIATGLCASGAAVTAVDLKSRPDALPDACDYLLADVTDPGVAGVAVDRASPDGVLDFLVNAAGVAWFDRDGSALEIPDELWDRVLAVNLSAPRRFARAAAPAMRRAGGGAMVHVASVAGIRGMDDPLDAYQVSKAGLISLSRSLAVQLGCDGIRSNAICPGAIETPLLADLYAEDPGRRERMAARTPIGRVGTPADVAGVCLHLLSDQGSFVTGTEVIVDGGWLAVMP